MRKYAVPGASREARRDALNEYLQHPAALAAAAPANLHGGQGVRRHDLRPARERRLAVGRELRLHARPGRPDAGLRHGAGLRGALGGQRPLRLRVAAEQPGRRLDGRLQRRRPTRSSCGSPRRSRTRRSRPRARAARTGATAASTARASRRSGAASRPGSARPARTRRRRRRRSSRDRPASSRSTTASFQFTADETGADFECSLDGAPLTQCMSPTDYTGLAAGSHHFEVRAVDPSGNADPSPAAADWTIVPADEGRPASRAAGRPRRARRRAAVHRAAAPASRRPATEPSRLRSVGGS